MKIIRTKRFCKKSDTPVLPELLSNECIFLTLKLTSISNDEDWNSASINFLVISFPQLPLLSYNKQKKYMLVILRVNIHVHYLNNYTLLYNMYWNLTNLWKKWFCSSKFGGFTCKNSIQKSLLFIKTVKKSMQFNP